MQLNTHLNIDTSLCGKVVKLQENYAEVLLHTTKEMSADTQGLVHGGFVFGAADYAVMSAVNDPDVLWDQGLYKFKDEKVFVTSGIGEIGLPLRFLIPPVIDVLELY